MSAYIIVDCHDAVLRDDEVDLGPRRCLVLRIVYRKIIDEVKIILIRFHPPARRRTAQFVHDDRVKMVFLPEPCQVFFRGLLDVDPLDALSFLDLHDEIVTWGIIHRHFIFYQ
jgi:hypothetical protein